MKLNSILFTILMVLSVKTNAQTANFDIIVKDNVVGEAVIIKKQISDNAYSIKYTFDASITIFFIKTTVDMDMLVNYKDGKMVSADINYLYNDKRTIKKYAWNGKHYDVTENGKKSILNEKVTFSTMNLYEKEPVGISRVFLENQNDFTSIKKTGKNEYFAKVDGDDCTYTYKDGELQSLLIDAFVNLTLKRRK